MSGGPDVTAWLQHAVGLHQTGRTNEAEALYDQVLAHAPENLDALNLKSVIAADAGRHEAALQLLERAARAHPTETVPHFNKALSLAALGRNEAALAAYGEVLRRAPNHADAHFERGTLLQGMGRSEEAIAAFRVMTTHCQSDPRGFYNLAVLLVAVGAHEDAARAVDHARKLRPSWPEAAGLSAEIAFACGAYTTAEQTAREALTLNSALVSAHRVLGDTLMRDTRYDEALTHYDHAIALDGALAAVRCNRGSLLARMGRHEDAIVEFRRALNLQPNDSEARSGLALGLLTLGRLAEGWALYALRPVTQKKTDTTISRPLALAPPQPGAPLRLLCDQGLGEQVMFSSLVPDLLKITEDIEIYCDARMTSLFQRSFPTLRFHPTTSVPPHLSGTLGDAARWLRKDAAAFPRHAGYLQADTAQRDRLRERYRAGSEKPLVGISWKSSEGSKFKTWKSIPLTAWRKILTQSGATFISLQYGDVAEEIDEANKSLGANVQLDMSVDPVKDVDAFAAQVAAMDLIITTSNTTAHMAGALNIPTLVLVPEGFGGVWHWFLNRPDNPWYPSVQLLRQTERGQWEGVLARAAQALADLISSHGHGGRP